MADAPEFLESFARNCVDAGTDVFLAQGSAFMLRGVETYKDGVIFYGPGDLFSMSDTTTKLPTEFYERFDHELDSDPRLSTPSMGFEARASGYTEAINSPGGYRRPSPYGNLIPVCSFSDDLTMNRITLHVTDFLGGSMAVSGVPTRITGDKAREVIEYVDELSDPYNTDVAFENGVGVISPHQG